MRVGTVALFAREHDATLMNGVMANVPGRGVHRREPRSTAYYGERTDDQGIGNAGRDKQTIRHDEHEPVR